MRFQYVLLGLVTLTPLHVSGDTKVAVCSNFVHGVQDKFFCCEAQCGTCGGVGCSQRPGGQFSCCMGRIWDSGILCSTNLGAPCIIDEEVPDEVCSNGVPGVQEGNSCCEAQCVTCGGTDCDQLPVLLLHRTNQRQWYYCSYTPVAPCIIDDGPAPTYAEPTPTPTGDKPAVWPSPTSPTQRWGSP